MFSQLLAACGSARIPKVVFYSPHWANSWKNPSNHFWRFTLLKCYAQEIFTTMKGKETLFPIYSYLFSLLLLILKVSVVFSSGHLSFLQYKVPQAIQLFLRWKLFQSFDLPCHHSLIFASSTALLWVAEGPWDGGGRFCSSWLVTLYGIWLLSQCFHKTSHRQKCNILYHRL